MFQSFSKLMVLWAALGLAGAVSCGGGGGGGGGGGPGGGGTPQACANTTKDGAETDVDCGGGTCGACAVGKACTANSDCQTGACCGNVCVGNFANLNFGAPAFVATGGSGSTDSQSIVAADFTGDKKVDIAVADTTGNVKFFTGVGDGTFGAPTTIPTTAGSTSVAAGDLNGDTFLDLVVGNNGGANSSVDVLINNGTGTFAKTNIPTVGTDIRHVALGDFDAKTGKDIATSNSGGNDVSIILNSGTGTFPAAPVHFTAGAKLNNPRGIASANFNGVGDDLAVANFNNADVVAMFSDGAGAFNTSNPNFPLTGSTSNTGVTVGDYNKDGKPDFAATSIAGTTSAYVLKNNGAGGFDLLAGNPVGKEPQSITTGDFNVDGKEDLATANTQGRNFLNSDFSVLIGKGDATFDAEKFFPNGGAGTTNRPRSIATGDFNNDCKPDVVLANDGGSVPNANTVSIILNTSN